MQVIYDAQIFLGQKTGGISRYHYELIRGGLHSKWDVKVAGIFVKNQYLLNDINLKKNFFYDYTASFAQINKFLLKRTLKRLKEQTIFHPANPYSYLHSEFPQVKNKVITIHDMIVEGENINYGKDKLFYANHASKIIAVSETTKKDIINLFNIDSNKIEVIYHGSSLFPGMAKRPSQQPLPDNYLLYVGTRNYHKNFSKFIEGIMNLLKKDKDLFLICVGKNDFSKKEILWLKEMQIENKVIAITKATDNELAYLYSNAKAFIFPSLKEGFGIPILEAWACGTPVILSNNECFKEIAAEAGFFFDPYSPESIGNSVEKVINDKFLQKDLLAKGTKRLQFFSWEKTVKQTHEVYESII